MKKRVTTIVVFLISLLLVPALGASAAIAGDIRPVGTAIGSDKQGNAIYQVPANGIKIGYKLIGAGAPLVMIAGLNNTMDLWPQAVIDTLAKHYQLVLLDNRGMGFTTSDDAAFTYKLFADDVIGLLDALKIEKTDVLGFSMGSTITQELLLEYPQRFNKAVIYATSTDGSSVAAALQGRTFSNPTVLHQLEATTQWKTPLDRLPLITNQVMLMVGTADTVVGVEGTKALAAAIPGAKLVQFKNATHGLVIEAPSRFAKIVLTFLDMDETVDRN